MFPVAFGANGQPPSPPTDASSTRRAGLERGERVRVARCSACCGSGRRTGTPSSAARETSRRTWPGTPTPIVSARTSVSGRAPATSAASSSTRPSSTSPSNGQPNATLIVTRSRIPSSRAALDDAAWRRERLRDRRVLVPLVERLGRAEGEPRLVEPGGDESVVARARSARAPRRRRRRPARARRRPPPLRPSAGRGARRRSSRPRPRGDARAREPSDEPRPNLGREDVRLVLEPVARPDVDDRDAPLGRHAAHGIGWGSCPGRSSSESTARPPSLAALRFGGRGGGASRRALVAVHAWLFSPAVDARRSRSHVHRLWSTFPASSRRCGTPRTAELEARSRRRFPTARRSRSSPSSSRAIRGGAHGRGEDATWSSSAREDARGSRRLCSAR